MAEREAGDQLAPSGEIVVVLIAVSKPPIGQEAQRFREVGRVTTHGEHVRLHVRLQQRMRTRCKTDFRWTQKYSQIHAKIMITSKIYI